MAKNRIFWFCILWIGALLLGTLSGAAASNSFLLLMRIAPTSYVSIAGLAVTLLLPFLFIALAIYMNRPHWLYPICFCKVFGLAFSGYGVAAAYGSAGWLVRFLFLFSDIYTTPILCYLTLRHIHTRQAGWKKDIGISAGIFLLAGALDLWFISPFLARIT